MIFEDLFIPSVMVTSICTALALISQQIPGVEFQAIVAYAAITSISYVLTNALIPSVKALTLKAGLRGKDINKKGTKAGEVDIPESLGIVPATIYLVMSICGILFTRAFLPDLVLSHVSALLGVSFIVFLGFADDVLDLAWRYKLVLPPIASLPLIVAYTGTTNVVVPHLLRPYVGGVIDLGVLYYIYMIMLATFQTNAINIYAGVNGLEVGQSLIIAAFITLHNGIEIYLGHSVQQHLFSLIVIIPYIFTSLALYKHNHFPSKVFVGDIFCYWSGMVFAVSGILGHFSKTLMLFCIPQIINFIYSLPQLFHIVPCPRHRLPRYNTQTTLLEPIRSNLTLINLFLLLKGPTSERNLCKLQYPKYIYIGTFSSSKQLRHHWASWLVTRVHSICFEYLKQKRNEKNHNINLALRGVPRLPGPATQAFQAPVRTRQ